MASEIKVTNTVTATTYDGVPFSHSKSSVAANQDATKKDGIKTVQELSTSFQALTWGDVGIANVPLAVLTNTSTDANNYLYVSFDGGTTTHLKVPSGHTAQLWMNSFTSATTNTKIAFSSAAGAVEVTLLETAM